MEFPIHLIVDTAPLFLGLFALLGGIRQDKIDALNHGLLGDLKSRTEDLDHSNQAKARMETELSIARRMQLSLVPTDFIRNQSLQMHACLLPAKELGGDFYDFFWLDSHRLCLAIGDVSGKGVPAALFMVVCKTLLKSIFTQNQDLQQTITQLNKELSINNTNYMFASVFMAIVDTKHKLIDYVNAGHCPALLKKMDGSILRLDGRHGPVAGAVNHIPYEPAIRLTWSPGDALLLYTDGVTEAQTEAGELFSEARLAHTFQNCKNTEPAVVVKTILQAVRLHEQGRPAFDDIALLCLHLQGES